MSKWIEWKANGPCPVADYEVVDVRFGDGAEEIGERAIAWDWGDKGDDGIIAYRLHTPSEPVSPPPAMVDGDGGEVERLKADAARYRYLRDHCSWHYPMTQEQPAEWSIDWEFQQSTPDEAYGSFDIWIDRDMADQAMDDAYYDAEADNCDFDEARAALSLSREGK